MVDEKKTKNKISPDILINDLVEQYPEVTDLLIYDYGFHCVGCIISEFESLVQGAAVHGIEGEDFDKLLGEIQEIIDKNS